MQSNYKRIGNYVKQVKLKNTDNSLTVEHLRGIRINKEFMPSVANVTGTDLSKYRVVKTHQCAYNPMHVGRDEALPISMLVDKCKIIVSPAYVIFEIVDISELLPEYLMIWCRRSEFDRNAWFTTDSSVRGGFSWDDFCDLELPVPSIDKQKEIVKEYHTITDRIKLNEQLNQKLEDTAQTIYKEWFVDFEFPNEDGKPYKSSGGEMLYCVELDMEIPTEWIGTTYEHVMNFTTGKLNSNAAVLDGKYPFFTCSAETFKTNTYSFDTEAVLLAGNNASAIYPLKFFIGKFDAYQRTYVITTNDNRLSNQQIYFTIKDELENFKGISSGTATKFLTMQILNNLKICLAKEEVSTKFHIIIKDFFNLIDLKNKELEQLNELKDVLLSKMATIDQSIRKK